MSLRGGVRSWVVGVLIAAGVPASAAAQTATASRTPVRASVTTVTVYDDNVLGRPVAEADGLLRVTPGIAMGFGHSRLKFSGDASFDAERYQTHPDLSTARARNTAKFDLQFESGPHTTWVWNVGQSSTTNPVELNDLTALNIGRQRANRWQGASKVRQALGPHAAMELGYDFGRDDLSGGSVTTTHTVEMRLSRAPTPHTDFYIRANGRQFGFGTAGAPSVTSVMTSGGWSARGKAAHITAEAGVQQTRRSTGSTVDVNAGRTFGRMDFTGGYGRGVTTAIGVAGTIGVDHVQAGLTYQGRPMVPGVGGHGPGGLRMAVRVGASRNQLAGGQTTSLQWTAELGRPLTRTLSLQLAYDGSTQQGAVGVPGPFGEDIRRNRVTLSLLFLPWSPK